MENRSLFRSMHGRLAVSLAVFVLLIFLVAVSVFYFVFGKVVPPNAVGLRQNYYGIPWLMPEGFQAEGLAPGLHWQIPFISDVHLLARDFQLIHFPQTRGMNLGQLEIPTTDGSKVRTDISLIVRFYEEPKAQPVKEAQPQLIKDEKQVPVIRPVETSHGGPKDLVNTYTANPERQLLTFVKVAENFLKRALSGLSTIDYYNPALREAAAVTATQQMNEEVNPVGIEVWAALIRRYMYVEKNIDDQIFAKNLQDQTERLNAALSALAEARAKTEEARATWDADISVLRTSGESRARVTDAEATRYEREKFAEGDKLVALAGAEIEGQKNKLLEASGADAYVARRILPLLSTLAGGIVSDIDPYDVNSWLQKLGLAPAQATPASQGGAEQGGSQ